MLIDFSLRKTKVWSGQAKYNSVKGQQGEGYLYLKKLYEESPDYDRFLWNFIYGYHHEVLHLLLKDLGIPGYRNEEKIGNLAEKLSILVLYGGCWSLGFKELYN